MLPRTNNVPASVTGGAGRAYPGGRSIGVRLVASFAAIVLLLIAAEAVALRQFRQMAAATQRMGEVDEASLAVFRVHFDITMFRDWMAALARSRDVSQFADEAGSMRARFLQDVEVASRMLGQSADIQHKAELSSALESLRVTLLSQLDASLELAGAGEWSGVQLRLQSQIPALVRFSSQLVEGVDRQVLQRRAEVIRITQVAQQRFLVEAVTAALLAALGATALSWYVTRTITVPLLEIRRGAEALARGDFRQRVAVGGHDELAVVGRAFDHAAMQLQQLYQDLQQSQQTLRDMINTIPAQVWTATPDGSVDFVNERLKQYMGLQDEEILGWGWERTVHPDDRARLVAEWRAAVGEGQPLESEARVRRFDGRYSWFIIRNVPVRDEAGKVLRWYGSGIEIEDRKRAEKERQRLHQLEVEIAHINRVTMLGELAASIAHEIKQPLTATIANASTCLRLLRSDRPDHEELRQAAGRIVKDGQRAAQVIDRLRSLYQKAPPKREPFEVNEVIREMIVLLRSEAEGHRVSIHTELAANVNDITADRVQLQQVLMNLMLNAIEAMKETGGELTLRSEREDGRLRISVSDTGVGLPKDSADQIFEAFFTTKPHGSGMGLAISRSIVEAHGGRLWATPNAGRGTTFHFTLPAAGTALQPLAPA